MPDNAGGPMMDRYLSHGHTNPIPPPVVRQRQHNDKHTYKGTHTPHTPPPSPPPSPPHTTHGPISMAMPMKAAQNSAMPIALHTRGPSNSLNRYSGFHMAPWERRMPHARSQHVCALHTSAAIHNTHNMCSLFYPSPPAALSAAHDTTDGDHQTTQHSTAPDDHAPIEVGLWGEAAAGSCWAQIVRTPQAAPWPLLSEAPRRISTQSPG